MLDKLSELVSTIVIIIILATFLDLLIPEGSIKKYVKLFIGFMILLTILNPIVSLLDEEIVSKPEDILKENEFVDTEQVISRGEEFKEDDLKLISSRYDEILREEVEALVDDYFSNYSLFDLKASYDKEWGKDFGDLNGLEVVLKKDTREKTFSNKKEADQQGVKKIAPVEVRIDREDVNANNSMKENKDSEKMLTSLPEYKDEDKNSFKKTLASKFFLSTGDIKVKIARRGEN